MAVRNQSRREPQSWVIQLKPGSDRTQEGIRANRIFICWSGMGADAADPKLDDAALRRIVKRAGLGRYEFGQYRHFVRRMGRGDTVFVPCEGGRYVEGVIEGPVKYNQDFGHWREVRWRNGGREYARSGLNEYIQRVMEYNRTCTLINPTKVAADGPGAAKQNSSRGRRVKPGSGQRWSTDHDLNSLVMKHAVRKAIRHYEDKGYSVQEKGKPYDLLCTRGKQELHVEVKGTRGGCKKIIVTRNEIDHALKNNTDLFILHGIKIKSVGKSPRLTGGHMKLIPAWKPESKNLRAIQFEYRISDR